VTQSKVIPRMAIMTRRIPLLTVDQWLIGYNEVLVHRGVPTGLYLNPGVAWQRNTGRAKSTSLGQYVCQHRFRSWHFNRNAEWRMMTTSPNRWRKTKGERAYRETERFIECGEEASHVFRCTCGSHLPHPTLASVLRPEELA
jgi:hypothetical protein